MILIITILSYILSIGVVGFLLIIVFSDLTDRFNNLINNMRYSNKLLGRKELGSEISLYSYYFSENKESYNLMVCLSEQIKTDGYINIDKLRDAWREKNKTSI